MQNTQTLRGVVPPLPPPTPPQRRRTALGDRGIGDGGAGGAGGRGGARGVSPPGIFCNFALQEAGRVKEYGFVDGDDVIHISWEEGVPRSQRVRDHSSDTGARKYNTV